MYILFTNNELMQANEISSIKDSQISVNYETMKITSFEDLYIASYLVKYLQRLDFRY